MYASCSGNNFRACSQGITAEMRMTPSMAPQPCPHRWSATSPSERPTPHDLFSILFSPRAIWPANGSRMDNALMVPPDGLRVYPDVATGDTVATVPPLCRSRADADKRLPRAARNRAITPHRVVIVSQRANDTPCPVHSARQYVCRVVYVSRPDFAALARVSVVLHRVLRSARCRACISGSQSPFDALIIAWYRFHVNGKS